MAHPPSPWAPQRVDRNPSDSALPYGLAYANTHWPTLAKQREGIARPQRENLREIGSENPFKSQTPETPAEKSLFLGSARLRDRFERVSRPFRTASSRVRDLSRPFRAWFGTLSSRDGDRNAIYLLFGSNRSRSLSSLPKRFKSLTVPCIIRFLGFRAGATGIFRHLSSYLIHPTRLRRA